MRSLSTIELTSKPLKAHLALSAFLFWFGLLSCFLPHGHSAEIAGASWSAFAVIIGAVCYVGTRVMVWLGYG